MGNGAAVTAVFERYRGRLLQHVAKYTPASPETVEDACAFAWLQWARVRPEEPRTWQWLFVVAWREAWRLHRREADDANLRAQLAAGERGEGRRLDPEPPVALPDAIARLRPRQRGFIAMQAAGLSYSEMIAATGDTFRTVD